MYDLNGKIAVVTGGAQGIGLGIARELARAGSDVVIGARNLRRAGAAAEELKRVTGREIIAISLDVTVEETVHQFVHTVIARFSRIDILVNNAGIHTERIGLNSTVEHFRDCFDVNLFGVWRVTQAVVPHLKASGRGKIVNIASINGRKPWADTPAYSASKAALINMTQALAVRLALDNINVNAVCPGGVITAMASAFSTDLGAMDAELVRQRLLKRSLLPEDIGHAVVFFASMQSRNITGQALNVDGGVVMS